MRSDKPQQTPATMLCYFGRCHLDAQPKERMCHSLQVKILRLEMLRCGESCYIASDTDTAV